MCSSGPSTPSPLLRIKEFRVQCVPCCHDYVLQPKSLIFKRPHFCQPPMPGSASGPLSMLDSVTGPCIRKVVCRDRGATLAYIGNSTIDQPDVHNPRNPNSTPQAESLRVEARELDLQALSAHVCFSSQTPWRLVVIVANKPKICALGPLRPSERSLNPKPLNP